MFSNHQEHCSICGNQYYTAVYNIQKNKLVNIEYFCLQHSPQINFKDFNKENSLDKKYDIYEIDKFYMYFYNNIFIIKLISCSGYGRPLFVDTGYLEICQLYHAIKHMEGDSIYGPNIFNMFNKWVNQLNFNIDKVDIYNYNITKKFFCTRVYLVKNKEIICLESRLSEGITLALVSNSQIFISKETEYNYYIDKT
jgi:hypothetical protein